MSNRRVVLGLKQVESVSNGKLEQQGSQKRSCKDIKRSEKTDEFLLIRILYKQIDGEKQEKILKQVEDVEETIKCSLIVRLQEKCLTNY